MFSMNTENLFDLYSQRILDLAMDIPHQTPIENFDGRAKKRSPVCGSELEVFVVMKDGHVFEFQQIVRTCALGQASASIFGQHVVGQNLKNLEILSAQLSAFLAKKGDVPKDPFGEYITLTPAQDYHNRHASIMLAVDTTIEAIKNASQTGGS